MIAVTAPATQPFACTGTWHGLSLTGRMTGPGQPVIIRENGLLLGIATARNAHWQPALGWRADAHGIKLKTQDGRQFHCRPAPY